MQTVKEIADGWKRVCQVFDMTRNDGPDKTIEKLLEEYSLTDVKEIFAAVAALKAHDGRISYKNRNYMNRVEIPKEAREWSHNNPMLSTSLDHIHTAHIDQMIRALYKIENTLDATLETKKH